MILNHFQYFLIQIHYLDHKKWSYKFNQDIIKSTEDLHNFMRINTCPFELKKYVDNKILIKFECDQDL